MTKNNKGLDASPVGATTRRDFLRQNTLAVGAAAMSLAAPKAEAQEEAKNLN